MARRSGLTSDGRAILATATAAYGEPVTLRQRRAQGVSLRLERIDQRGGPPILRHVCEYEAGGAPHCRVSYVQVPHRGMAEPDSDELVAAIAADEIRLLGIAQRDKARQPHAGSIPSRS